jgi:hypothetical protein
MEYGNMTNTYKECNMERMHETVTGAMTGMLSGWGADTKPIMGLFLVDEMNKKYPERVAAIRDTAMHEFGHILELFDAYENYPFVGMDATLDRALKNDVMLSGLRQSTTQTVFNYNIGMMLYAFRDSRLQNYGNETIHGMESEIFFRVKKLD